MKRFFCLFILVYILSVNFTVNVNAQNDLVHPMYYFSHDQNMWGPDSAYGIDVEHTFFNVNINENYGFSQIESVFGQQFGVGVNMGIQALLRSTFEAHGFYTGSFSLDYPIEVTLDFPEDFSFNYGGPATIKTSYEVVDGWALETEFPPVGVITLDLEYQFTPSLNLVVCVFGCDTIYFIPPSVQVPHTLDTLFHINAETEYCIYPCYVGNQFTFCHDYELPIDISFTDLVGFNFEAHVDLPNVETTAYIEPGTNCLIATGEDPYMEVILDVIGFLYVMAGYIPPPDGPQIQQALDFLNDTINYPINTPLGNIEFQIEYSLLSVDFLITNTLHQDIYFCPTIWVTLEFPVEMPYIVTDPSNGDAMVSQGFGDTITFAVGHDLTITYPCHDWDSMYVGVRYNIQPTIRNHTWDSLAFSFLIQALSADITIITPFKSAIAQTEMPEFVLPLPGDNPPKSPPIAYAGYYADAENPEAKDIGPFHIGPLFEWTVSLGYVPVTWFDQTWDLMHFQEDLVFPGTYIRPYDKSEVNALLFLDGAYCYGQPFDYVYAEAQNGIEPYTFIWSTGHVTPNSYFDTDSIFAPPGLYSVTIIDSNNCESYDTLSVAVNPPLILSLSATDVDCHGFFTGQIQTNVSGGTPPYFFHWSNGSIAQNPSNLASGWYYVTIEDFVHCEITDSIFIAEPPTAVTITESIQHVRCHGTDDGRINISLSGATPPYSVQWSTGQVYQNLYNLTAGNYTISVTDALGCTWSETYTIIEPDTLIANVSSTNIPCFGLNNGILQAQVYGGTPPYIYYWFHDLNNNSPILTNMHPGYYFVSVVDANGCSDTASAYINEPDELQINLVYQNVSCKYGNDAYISVNPSGGVPNYYVQWSNGYFSNSINNLSVGTFTVTVRDSNGCEKIQTVNITEPEFVLTSSFNEINHVSCFGGNDASANVLPHGGTPPYTVTWEDGVDQDGFRGTGMLANIFYSITLTDANNCVYFDSIRFTQPPLLNATGTTNPVNCAQNPGSANITVVGGTPPYTYLWSNGETIQNPIDLPAGTVIVTITDSKSCIKILELSVVALGNISGGYVILEPNLCFGDSIAVATVYINNPYNPVFFMWDNQRVGDTVQGLSAGTYYVTATDRYNCNGIIEVVVPEPDSVQAGFVFTRPSCSGVYDGEIKSVPTGGTPDYSFLWFNNTTTDEVSGLREGLYYLTISDANNCVFVFEADLREEQFCVIVYNTITPNGDGANDTWIIEKIEEFRFNKVFVHNRLGNLVYSAEGYKNDWDGTYNGKPLPEGTYYYLIDLGTGKDPIKGHLTIIR
jgi:gliding motility-associated-like protein